MGTDDSVPSGEPPISLDSAIVDRAVCPHFSKSSSVSRVLPPSVRGVKINRTGKTLPMKLKYLVFALAVPTAFAQVSTNASLTGKYYFRQILLITDGTANVTHTHSGNGTITFDGKGTFTVSGQVLVDTTASAALSTPGTYNVNAGGFVTLTNPLQSTASINARLGQGALVGSSTEAGPTVFDLFIAIPAPAQPVSTSTLNGAYWISSLEFPNGGVADIRDTNSKLTANGSGSFAETMVTGQAANLGNRLQTQTVGPITYTVAADGTGTLTFPLAAGTDATTQLISGVKNVYVSQDGSYFIGGSTATGLHGLVVGVKAFASGATNASWTGRFFAAGMRYDTAPARLAAVSGSVNAGGDGNSEWARRTRQSDGLFDAAPLIQYSLGADGSGAYPSIAGHLDVASTGNTFASSGVDIANSESYEIYFGSMMPPQSGTGVFLNPQGIFNAASFAPAGFPIAPGEFLQMYGTGFGAQSASTSTFPILTTLAGVQVNINNLPAPVYSVTVGSLQYIDAIVPFGVTGSTATIVVTVNKVPSNSVILPLAATAPGVFSVPPNGISAGAIRHADGTLCNASSPATRGEILPIYVGGLGVTNPSVNDGAATPNNGTLYKITGPVNVYVGGQLVTNIPFAGLVPTVAGLYQINIQIPAGVASGPQSLAVQTNEGFTDMVTIYIQ